MPVVSELLKALLLSKVMFPTANPAAPESLVIVRLAVALLANIAEAPTAFGTGAGIPIRGDRPTPPGVLATGPDAWAVGRMLARRTAGRSQSVVFSERRCRTGPRARRRSALRRAIPTRMTWIARRSQTTPPPRSAPALRDSEVIVEILLAARLAAEAEDVRGLCCGSRRTKLRAPLQR